MKSLDYNSINFRNKDIDKMARVMNPSVLSKVNTVIGIQKSNKKSTPKK